MKISAAQIAQRRHLRPALHLVVCVVFSFCTLAARGWPVSSVRTEQQAANKTVKTSGSVPAQDPGERKFQANCSRCHSAPEQLPTRITGTIVRHMRVRASLSAEDERDILRYLAP